MIKEEILAYQEGRKNDRRKIWGNTIDFCCPLRFSKLCLTVEALAYVVEIYYEWGRVRSSTKK
jgi:hypothetical protein